MRTGDQGGAGDEPSDGSLASLDEAETGVSARRFANSGLFTVDAHRDLAQLIWMRTEDKAQAVATSSTLRSGTAIPTAAGACVN